MLVKRGGGGESVQGERDCEKEDIIKWKFRAVCF